MNRRQRIATFIGFCVIAGMLLVPPWKYVKFLDGAVERDAGYAFVFSPPSVKDHEAIREAYSLPKTLPTGEVYEISERIYEVRLDTMRLLAQCGVGAFLTLGLVVALYRKRYFPFND